MSLIFCRVLNNYYLCNVIARRTKDLVDRITVNAVFLFSTILEFPHKISLIIPI